MSITTSINYELDSANQVSQKLPRILLNNQLKPKKGKGILAFFGATVFTQKVTKKP